MIPGVNFYRLAAYGLMIVLIFGAGYHQGKKAFYELEAHVAVLGNLARKAAEELAERNRVAKEKADADYKKLSADNKSLARSLRDARTRERELSASTPTP